MQFIVVTSDYAGLGFAIRLREEGHEVVLATNPKQDDRADPERWAAYERVGQGLVDKQTLTDVIAKRETLRDAYWIWDFNHSLDENELLRSEGFRVFGGGKHADCMEHDRAACLAFTERYGLQAPPSYPFSSTAEAIQFCEANPTKAFVFKPDEGANFETFLPESEEASDASFELRKHLASLRTTGQFLLQERKDGVETNVEVWFQRGEPVFAFVTLECKKRYTGDQGELVGCAFDFSWTVPLRCRAVTESVGKLFPAYREMNYTGFADANFIAARDGIWFFEKCERFGYNAHPNLFWNLNLSTLGDVLANLTDGTFRPCFSGGFGASLTMSTRPGDGAGKAIQFPGKLSKDIYYWDVYLEGDQPMIAGYDKDGYVLILTAFGYTIPTAWEALLRRADQIRFPYRHYRIDGDSTTIPTSPIRRYEALTAMGYL